jgi:hypothetical protein
MYYLLYAHTQVHISDPGEVANRNQDRDIYKIRRWFVPWVKDVLNSLFSWSSYSPHNSLHKIRSKTPSHVLRHTHSRSLPRGSIWGAQSPTICLQSTWRWTLPYVVSLFTPISQMRREAVQRGNNLQIISRSEIQTCGLQHTTVMVPATSCFIWSHLFPRNRGIALVVFDEDWLIRFLRVIWE